MYYLMHLAQSMCLCVMLHNLKYLLFFERNLFSLFLFISGTNILPSIVEISEMTAVCSSKYSSLRSWQIVFWLDCKLFGKGMCIYGVPTTKTPSQTLASTCRAPAAQQYKLVCFSSVEQLFHPFVSLSIKPCKHLSVLFCVRFLNIYALSCSLV